VAASESTKYSALNTGTVKRVTGGNEIYCAFKHQTHFSYRPEFKIWLSSNHPVNADPDDEATWYRIKVIHFPHSFVGQEDKTLKKRLREPANLRGVLAWAVAGAIAWYGRRNGLGTPEQVQAATDEARRLTDFVQQWLDECTTEAPGEFVSNAALYASYKEWCEEVGRKPKGIAGLTRTLRDKGFDAGQQKWFEGKNRRGCYGILLTA